MRKIAILLCALLLATFAVLFRAEIVTAEPDTVPGALRSYTTVHSIGIEWDIAGDDDHEAFVPHAYVDQNGNDKKGWDAPSDGFHEKEEGDEAVADDHNPKFQAIVP